MLVFSFCLSRPVTMSFRFPLTLFSCCLFSRKKRNKKTGPPLETHNAKATQRASPPKRTQFDCQAVQAHTPQSNFFVLSGAACHRDHNHFAPARRFSQVLQKTCQAKGLH
jgi:hypothetical protein